jgi:hypothetical protein
VILNPNQIARIEITAAHFAFEKMFSLGHVLPIGALAEHGPARSRFGDWHDHRLGWDHLGDHLDIAGGAVKGDAVLVFENPKALGKAIHPYIERVIHLRKLGSAGLFALGTAVVFNPMLAGRHHTNMHLRLLRSTFNLQYQIRKT